jgi:hypothetical protein
LQFCDEMIDSKKLMVMIRGSFVNRLVRIKVGCYGMNSSPILPRISLGFFYFIFKKCWILARKFLWGIIGKASLQVQMPDGMDQDLIRVKVITT